MGRCSATTRKGTRCRNAAMDGSDHCGVHAAPDATMGSTEGASGQGDAAWPAGIGETARTLLGLAALGLVVLIGMRFGSRF